MEALGQPASSRPASRFPLAVLAILAAALIVRLLFVLKVAPDLVHGDQGDYLDAAERLLSGRPMAFRNFHLFVRPPGFSLFVALVWLVTGSKTIIAIKVAQAFVGTGTCLYVYLLARSVRPTGPGALLALAMASFYPYFIHFTAMAGTETLCTFFVAAGTYHVAVGLSPLRPRLASVAIGGAMFALGNLVRANLTVLWPLLGLWLLFRYRRDLPSLGKVALALAVPLLIVSVPWGMAVARQGLGTMFITDGAGIYYYMGHGDTAAKLYCSDLTPAQEQELHAYGKRLPFEPAYLAAKAAPQGQQSKVFLQAALEWDRQHLSLMPCLAMGKLWGYWRPFVRPGSYSRAAVLVSLASLPVIVFGFVGMWGAWKRGEHTLTVLTALQVLAGTAAAVIFSTEVRYRIQTVDVLLLPFAGLAIAAVLEKARQRFLVRAPAT